MYTGNTNIYWQSSWLKTDALRGGLFAMKFKV